MKSILFFLSLCICTGSAGQSYRLVKTLPDHRGGISCLAQSPEAPVVLAGDSSGYLYTYSTDGRLLQAVKGHEDETRSFAFNSTGKLLISTSAHELKIWNISSLAVLHRLGQGEYADIRFGLFSIADGFIYFNSGSRLYKTRSDLRQAVVRLYDFPETVTAGAITPDRSALIVAAGAKLLVINTRSDNIIQELHGAASSIDNMSLMPGSRLATWSADGTVTVWRLNLGMLDPVPLIRFKAGFSSRMSFSSDGSLMASGNIGNWARIWNWQERSIVQELFSHTATVTALAFASGDDLLFTGSADKTIRIWSRRPEAMPEPEPPVARPPEIVPTPAPDTIVKFDEKNIPVQVKGRSVSQSENFTVTQEELEVYVFDNLTLDGDTVSMSFNGDWVLKDYAVEKVKKRLLLHFQKGNNSLVLYAENLGKSPPNTAAVEFEYEGRKKIIRLKSDLKSCSALNFILK